MKNPDIPDPTIKLLTPPHRCKNLLADIWAFFFHKPEVPSLIQFKTESERENYSQRILQRLGQDVGHYSVLNIHQIGVNAPVRYVFEELLHWDGDSTCWPNHLARVKRLDGKLEHMHILLLGLQKYPFPFKKSLFGLKFIPLFQLDALRFQHVPDLSESDNARYLLFKCSGGYPIGIFFVYTRSSIAEQQEKEPTQLFMSVGFNFYGRNDVGAKHILNRVWEKIHNRVTGNIMNRLKQICEWQFQEIQKKIEEQANEKYT